MDADRILAIKIITDKQNNITRHYLFCFVDTMAKRKSQSKTMRRRSHSPHRAKHSQHIASKYPKLRSQSLPSKTVPQPQIPCEWISVKSGFIKKVVATKSTDTKRRGLNWDAEKIVDAMPFSDLTKKAHGMFVLIDRYT